MTAQIGRARGRPRSFNGGSASTQIQSLARAMSVLKIVSENNGMSLTEIAKSSGHPASTVYRVLITLQSHHIVEHDEISQLWRIGLEAFRIGSAFLGHTSIVEQSRSIMQDVMSQSGETANLAIVDRGEVIFINQVETSEPIRAFFRPGTRSPVHASGIGKAILAFLPHPQIENIIDSKSLTAITEKTITDKQSLIEELSTIHGRGWSIDDEEGSMGMRCIAAPIFNSYGEATAGISLSGPSIRVAPEHDSRFGALIKEAAQKITHAIGGKPPSIES